MFHHIRNYCTREISCHRKFDVNYVTKRNIWFVHPDLQTSSSQLLLHGIQMLFNNTKSAGVDKLSFEKCIIALLFLTVIVLAWCLCSYFDMSTDAASLEQSLTRR